MTAYWCERALVADTVESGVLVEIEAGRFTAVQPGSAPGAAYRLAGLTIPGFANCHSHAFHRALRGRTQRGTGSFWTWREQMYALAGRLDPQTYGALARAVFREMASVGITSVGEFHYVHHRPDGTPYADPNAIGRALISAARDVGVRIALLDTCYLAAGFGQPLEPAQRRFGDGDAAGWAERVSALAEEPASEGDDGVVVGAAVHSVRAVPAGEIPVVTGWARERGVPLHVHLSEQTAENDACVAATGRTPTELLADAGALGPLTSAVHATHLTDRDIELLGRGGTVACFCPTTERDLGDGIGPAPALRAAGCPLTLGSDSHAVIDPFEEMRGLELNERLASRTRGHFTAAELLAAGGRAGHASLGFADTGEIAVGFRADLVTLDTASPRTAGAGGGVEAAVFAAAGADVTHVVADGRELFSARDAPDVGRELAEAITAAWGEP